MNEPSLVMDEPTATGWQRTELFGDKEIAKNYIHRARSVLGEMRAMYGVNERIATGEAGGFYHQWKELEDGTKIHAITNNGHDTVRIYSSSEAIVKEEKRPERIDRLIDVIIAGHCYPNEGTTRSGVIWNGNDTPTDLGFLPNGYWTDVHDISEDGSTVVGSCRVIEGGFQETRAWRWREETGMQDLGVIAASNYDMIATGVSEDGAIVCGIGSGLDANTVAWVWTQDGGFDILPHDALGVPSNSRPKISPNGAYVCGELTTPLVDGSNSDGVVWSNDENGWASAMIPRPGTISENELSGFPPATTYADTCTPRNVNDEGMATGSDSHSETFTYRSGTTFWDQGTGVPHPFISGVEEFSYYTQTRVPVVSNVFQFDAPTLQYRTFGLQGLPSAAADLKYAIIGNDNTGIQGDIVQEENPPPPEVRSRVVLYGIYVDFVKNGWYWTERQGKVSLGPNTFVADISEGAKVIVGNRIEGEFVYPVFWKRGDGPEDLPLLPGTEQGEATCVAGRANKLEYAEPNEPTMAPLDSLPPDGVDAEDESV